MSNFIFIVLIIAAVAVILFFINKKIQELKDGGKNDGAFLMLQNQLNELQRNNQELQKMMEQKLGDNYKSIQMQHGQSTKIIQEVTAKLEQLDATNKKVVGFAEQMQSLENILKSPKQRGILGEYFLETLLKNVFQPNQYKMQYKFKNGDIVDAAIFIKDKIIPIDSKFSLENYNKIIEEKDTTQKEQLEKIFKQDLKNRIDETSKYIRPSEDTFDFAFMFIPSEGIYYDLLINQVGAIKVNTRDLIEYAFKEKRVIIVSPTSFFAYLQTVMQGLRAMQIEESAKEIKKRVQDLGRHLSAYEEFMQKLGVNLGTTVNSYNFAYKELNKIDKDVLRITGEAVGVEIQSLDKPDEI